MFAQLEMGKYYPIVFKNLKDKERMAMETDIFSVLLSSLLHCDKMPEVKQLKEEVVYLDS